MSVENHIRRAIYKTAVLHTLKNKSNAPERTARNILDLFCRLSPDAAFCPFSYEELLQVLTTSPEEASLDWILKRVSQSP